MTYLDNHVHEHFHILRALDISVPELERVQREAFPDELGEPPVCNFMLVFEKAEAKRLQTCFLGHTLGDLVNQLVEDFA